MFLKDKMLLANIITFCKCPVGTKCWMLPIFNILPILNPFGIIGSRDISAAVGVPKSLQKIFEESKNVNANFLVTNSNAGGKYAFVVGGLNSDTSEFRNANDGGIINTLI